VNMKNFEDLKFEQHPLCDGVQARMDFDNGYGVSVIKTTFSYGSDKGLYEVAVIKVGEGVCYTTPIPPVTGNCTKNNVSNVMKKVQEL